MSFKIGDSVVVKQGVKEPDSEGFEIGVWQGRIIEIDKLSNAENIVICIEWDSITLNQLPSNYIHKSEIDGLDWQIMNLYDTDIDKTVSRDNPNDVTRVQDLLTDKYCWSSIGDEGLRISEVLEGLKPDDDMACYDRWFEFLSSKLSFPLNSIITDSSDSWLIKTGDRIQIKSLSNIADLYGIIAKIKFNGKSYDYPLCDIRAIDIKSSDYQLINDYRVWFANR